MATMMIMSNSIYLNHTLYKCELQSIQTRQLQPISVIGTEISSLFNTKIKSVFVESFAFVSHKEIF